MAWSPPHIGQPSSRASPVSNEARNDVFYVVEPEPSGSNLLELEDVLNTLTYS